MIRAHPKSTRTCTLFPTPTLFRSIRVTDLDLIERDFVAGEMDDLPGLGGVAAVTDRRQVVAQELAAAMDMRQREFGTVGGGIAASANVSGVMKQRDQHAEIGRAHV